MNDLVSKNTLRAVRDVGVKAINTSDDKLSLSKNAQQETNAAHSPMLGSHSYDKNDKSYLGALSNIRKTAKKTIEKPPTRTRKAVSAFRRKGRLADYETWRGRIGVHLPVDEYDLKEVDNAISSSLPGWDYANHYDLIRLWQKPIDINPQETFAADLIPDAATTANYGGVIMDAATPEIFIFSFGAVVFYNFQNEKAERIWIAQHLSNPDLYRNKHPAEAAAAGQDDLVFEYLNTSDFLPTDEPLNGAELGEVRTDYKLTGVFNITTPVTIPKSLESSTMFVSALLRHLVRSWPWLLELPIQRCCHTTNGHCNKPWNATQIYLSSWRRLK